MNPIAALWPFCLQVIPGTPRPHGSDWMVGVYFLLDGDEIVYVGQSINIQVRINRHASANRGPLSSRSTRSAGYLSMSFDRAIWMPLPAHHLDAFEAALIRNLRPRYNAQVPRVVDAEASLLAALGLEAA